MADGDHTTLFAPLATSACRWTRLLACVLATTATVSALAEQLPGGFTVRPDGLFVQAGAGHDARTITIGLVWDWDWRARFAWGDLTAYGEASIGSWHSDGGSEWTRHTQIGFTPVLRFHPTRLSDAWFVEIGVGLNIISPLYRAGDRRFGTAFNFGDHVAVGRAFGTRKEHEVLLRFQHYSNGGIKKPNPGEDFLQLRYVQRF